MMITPLTLMLLAQVQPRIDVEPGHQGNPIYIQALHSVWSGAGAKVEFPGPILQDGLDASGQHQALLKLAGSERALADLLRDSVTAPSILKVHDQKRNEATIRIVDLWFAVRADLAEFHPLDLARQTSGKAAEAGNMRFESRLLTEEELKRFGLSSEEGQTRSRWFTQLKSRLLDRIAVQTTDETVATRTSDSLVIASRTDPGFDVDSKLANRWQSIKRNDSVGEWHEYVGGTSYAKVSRLKQPRGMLLVEFHGAFLEPKAWFQGAPILRSKFAPVAQDQIRQLRRELLRARKKSQQPSRAAP
ncbi:MAG: hypothetical protein ACP5XB_24885 [Isosphaeraceae bacterium]